MSGKSKQFRAIFLLLLVTIFLFGIVEIANAATIDQSNTSGTNIANTRYSGQTFTTGTAGTLSSINLKVDRNSNGTTANLSVYKAGSDGLPSGAVLASINNVSIPNNNGFSWVSFDFSTHPTLTANTLYLFVVTTNNSTNFQHDSANAYSDGNRLKSSNGTSWSAETGDLQFQTLMNYNNTDLTGLAISQGTLSPAFSSATTGYSASVAYGIAGLTVTPTASTATGVKTIKVNNVLVASGAASANIPLTVGTNTISVAVTAEDGTTTKTYTITVTRAESTNTDLTGLVISQGTLSPAFSSATTGYSANVAYSIAGLTVTPTASTATGVKTIKVNNVTVASGAASANIPLAYGANTVSVLVTAEDGTTTKTYSIAVTRALPSSNADLTGLSLSQGTLSPAFASPTTGYSASVAYGIAGLTVTPTASTATGVKTIKVNNVLVASGSASANIPLTVGTNTISVAVTAEDGTTTKTYTVTVTRAVSTNTDLTGLVISQGTLSPSFASATTGYSASVAYSIAGLTVTPTASTATGVKTIKVNNVLVASGAASANIPLAYGANTVSVLVTAEDGTTTKTYSITVTRALPSSNTDLSGLSISQGVLSPSFTSGTVNYTVIEASGTAAVTVTPTTITATGIKTIQVNGTAVTSGTASGNIVLGSGTNNILVLVTAEDGTTTKTYTVTVYVDPPVDPSKKYLDILEVQPGIAYELSVQSLNTAYANLLTAQGKDSFRIRRMSMPEFISNIEDINGKYDIVYVGNLTSGGAAYSAIGAKSASNPGGGSEYLTALRGLGSTAKTAEVEYYDGNDITNRKTAKLVEYIAAGQLTVFNSGIFTSPLAQTNLYNNFDDYKDNAAYPAFDTTANIGTYDFNAYSTAAKRPGLEMTARPVQYNGSNGISDTDKNLGFTFNILSKAASDRTMTVKLFVDLNGDGLYTEGGSLSELVEWFNGQSDTQGFSINHTLPLRTVGLQPWKIEVTDNQTGAKNYQTGATAFIGDDASAKRIRVLQLISDSNTFRLADVGSSYLAKTGEYTITVDTMKTVDFDNTYIAGNTPKLLNGFYDMVIFGFADVYPGGDLKQPAAILELKAFIENRQSVMFTHDTISPNAFTANSSWGGKNLTLYFRDLIGQNIYANGHKAMPESSSFSFGITRLALNLANGIQLIAGNPTSYTSVLPDTKNAHKLNENDITQYPYPLGDIIVSLTHHQYFQLDLEDPEVVPVFTLQNGVLLKHEDGSQVLSGGQTIPETRFNQFDGRNDYYTYSKGNITYSGTGHRTPNIADETKMFINTMLKAVKGSNLAPTVQIQNYKNGDNISKNDTKVDFEFIANDSDINDQYLSADVYIANVIGGVTQAYTLVDHYTQESKHVEIGKKVAVQIDKTDRVADQISIKVVVKDTFGAPGVATVLLNQILFPQLTISPRTDKSGYLTGDTAEITLDVLAKNSASGYTINNIRLNASGLDADRLEPVNYAGDWTLSGTTLSNNSLPAAVFAPDPSWTKQTLTYGLKVKSVALPTVVNGLTYDLVGGTTRSFSETKNLTIPVNSGKLIVEVTYRNAGKNDVPVIIEKIGDQEALTDADSLTVNGRFSKTGLSTGDYDVSIDEAALNASGFTVESYKTYLFNGVDATWKEIDGGSGDIATSSDITQTLSLDYNDYAKKIVYELSGDAADSLKVTSNSKTTTAAVPAYLLFKKATGGSVNSEISFNLTRDVEALHIVSSAIGRNGTSAPMNLLVSTTIPVTLTRGTTVIDSADYTVRIVTNADGSKHLELTLDKPDNGVFGRGAYQLKFGLAIGANGTAGDYTAISFSAISGVKEPDVLDTYNIPISPAAALHLKTVEYPNIQ